MAQEIEIKLESFTDDERHKIRNFLEDLWVEIGRAGWAPWENFDQRVVPGARFTFRVTTRRKLRDAEALVERTIVKHMMGLYTDVTTRKVEDG